MTSISTGLAWPRTHDLTPFADDHPVYESRHHKPVPRPQFFRRLGLHFAVAAALVVGSLLLGMAGYMYFEDLPWRERF